MGWRGRRRRPTPRAVRRGAVTVTAPGAQPGEWAPRVSQTRLRQLQKTLVLPDSIPHPRGGGARGCTLRAPCVHPACTLRAPCCRSVGSRQVVRGGPAVAAEAASLGLCALALTVEQQAFDSGTHRLPTQRRAAFPSSSAGRKARRSWSIFPGAAARRNEGEDGCSSTSIASPIGQG